MALWERPAFDDFEDGRDSLVKVSTASSSWNMPEKQNLFYSL